MQECPARLDIPGYVELVGEDRPQEALDLVRQGCCLPGTIGRVCVRGCESRCTRKAVDESVSIKSLKRYAADAVRVKGEKAAINTVASRDERIAIVGAGPAGLSCAYYLGLRGYRTTLFEALGEPGGMTAVGIPDYRLPRAVLRGEADRVKEVGGEIRYGIKVGADITLLQMFNEGYKVIFVGAGAPGSSNMGTEGEDAGYAGFMPGVEFLRRVAFGERPLEGKKILVVGGGNVAMDCVRSARRLGFEDVNLIYRRTEKEMPADRVEIDESKEEGIHFHTLVNPVKIIAQNGRVTGVECVRMALGEPDSSGRRRPVPQEGSNFVIDCDAIVPAIGQACEINTFAIQGMTVARNNTLVVDPVTMQSSDPRIFGGGDCVTGPSTLIAALAAGRRAARHIVQYIETGACTPDREEHLDAAIAAITSPWTVTAPPFVSSSPRQHPPVVDPDVRVGDFAEVEGVFSPVQARREADRCLRCYRIAIGAFA
jgi:formate dehydrogenase beta subunit